MPRWELLSRLPPPREQVSQLKQQMREAVSRMRAKGIEKKDSGVVPIFNPSPGRYQMQTSPDLSARDCKRAREGTLPQPAKMDPLTFLLLMHLCKAGKLSKRRFGKSVALYSYQGCEVQPWHIDFSDKPKPKPQSKKAKVGVSGEASKAEREWAVRVEQLEGIRGLQDREKPLGVFWALEKGCKIMLAGPGGEAVEVCLEEGDVLLFDGDLVHAGAAYPDCDNIRMHVYLYAEGIVPPGGGTWFVPEFVPTRHVVWHSRQRRAASV